MWWAGVGGVVLGAPAQSVLQCHTCAEPIHDHLAPLCFLQGSVVVIRYEGPKGGPGMPEMLTPTSAIMGAGLGKECALITDGRFSGGSHGFVIGHVCPEAQEGGPIALVKVGGWGWARGQVPVCGGALSAHGTRAGGASGPIVCPAGVSHWPACLPLMPVSMPPCASLP